jgi:hypothetical protein
MLRQVMSRWHFLVLLILAMMLLGTTADGASSRGESHVSAEITRAVLAPWEAIASQNAPVLCADFVPAVAAELVPKARPGSTCQAAVEEAFTSATIIYKPSLAGAKVQDIVIHGDRASAELVSIKTKGKRNIKSVAFDATSLKLEEIAGRWLLASPALLIAVKGCGIPLHRTGCPPNSNVLALAIVSSPEEPPLPSVPVAVGRAGGKELSDFKAGRTVYAQSGCAACHRIGDYGNARPGPNLTHVASRLPRQAIARTLVNPTAPMPSFKNLPAKKFKAVVEFLSLLR